MCWAGEMVRWLRTLADLLEDPGSIPSPTTHDDPQSAGTAEPGHLMPTSVLCGYQICMWYTDIHVGKIPISTKISKVFCFLLDVSF